MAILKGFPPSNTISPSVRITEKDLSFVTSTPSLNRIGLVGFASKGPINTPTTITTLAELTTVFGNPHPDTGDPYLIYAAQLALQVSNEVTIVRVAETSLVSPNYAKTASVEVLPAGAVISVASSTAGPISFSDDKFFRWKLNGVLASKTLVVLADASRPSPDTGNPYTIADLVDELNAQLVPSIDGIEFVVNDPDGTPTLGVETTWAYGTTASLEFVSVQDMMVGGASNLVGLGDNMTAAIITGNKTHYPVDASHTTPNVWDFSGLASLELQVVVDGTDNVNVDNVAQVVDLSSLITAGVKTTAQVVTAINSYITLNLPGGFEAYTSGGYNILLRTLTFGRDAKISVKAASTADTILGLDNNLHSGSSPSAVSTDVGSELAGIITGPAYAGSDPTFTVNADSPGIDGNDTQILITNEDGGIFNIQVFSNGNPVEAWGNLTKDQTSRFYVGTYLDLVSDYIKITDNTAISAPPADTASTGLALSGGTDGIPTDPDDQDSLLIGSPVAFTGLYAFSEPEQIDIDLLAVPGHSSTSVVVATLNVCQNYRQDCLGIIDPPFGLTPQEIVDWQNGVHPLNTTQFDSDFGALYWPWVKIRDTYNNLDVWVPPSGAVLATIARSDNLAFPWFAPAGTTRGVVPGITDVYTQPTLTEKDLMYGNRNAINPIVTYPDIAGFVIWGQKTLQRRPTALDRVNVRRLMFYLEKNIRAQSRNLLFEPHTAALRARFVDLANGVLQNVKTNQGVYDYVIKCDEELNTADVIDRNEMRARIGVQPVKAAEFIYIEFSLHRTGSFTENTEVVV